MMSLSSSIRRQIRTQEEKKVRLQKERADLVDAQDSLEQFQISLGRVQSNFGSSNSHMAAKLADLGTMSDRCVSAERYVEGMNNTLDGVGGRVVGVAFTGLGVMVRVRLLWYEGQIDLCDLKIREVEARIRQLRIALAAALAAEAEAEKD